MRHVLRMFLLLSISSQVGIAYAQEAGGSYDTIIRGGTIVDGSGLPAFRGDVAIKGGHIAAIGDLEGAVAATRIDAAGLIVAPGFINIHSHAEPDAMATAVNMLTQGVVTEITNADGSGDTDIMKQVSQFKAKGLAENIGFYIGFNAAWQEVVGAEDRRATPAEIATMRKLIDTNLARGAWGVASGLDYKPAYYAEADEVVRVISAARKWRTNFPNHDRLRPEEGTSSYKGMVETIAIAKQAGLVPVVTHIKSQGHEQGNAPAVIRMFDQAAAGGIYVAADIYPYLAGATGLADLIIPGWAQNGGRQEMLKRFADPTLRAKIIVAAEDAMTARLGGFKGVMIPEIGKSLADVMAEYQVGAGEAVIRLLEKQDYGMIAHFGKEEDLIAFLKYPSNAVACDCGASTRKGGHPRYWGSFPRVLGHYVRETKVLGLEDAVRKMTALPATILGMTDRGYLAPGMSADIAIFDPGAVRDHATYEKPTERSDGIRHVFVNGQLALRNGVPTGAQGGKAILRTGHMPSRPMNMADRERSISAAGTVSGASSRFAISLAVTQAAGDHYATGRLRLVDQSTGTAWTADRLGVLQTYSGWASVTASLRDGKGNSRSAVVTLDEEGEGDAAKPVLILSLDGQADLVGSPTHQAVQLVGND